MRSADDLRINIEPLPVRTGTYFSHALGQERPYAYIVPAAWDGHLTPETTRYPLLVLLHGRDGHYTDWTQYTRIARYAAAYEMVVAFPEGDNGWYTNAADGSLRYEDDLIQDFLPHLQATLPLLPPGKAWGIGGLSMGGYGAVKIALKYPELFALAVGHSGVYEKPKMPEGHPIFGDPNTHAAHRYAENPFALAERALCRWPTERTFLYLDCGLSDGLLESNRRFTDHLRFIGYPHDYAELPGQHTWPYWDRALRTRLPALTQKLGAAKRSALRRWGERFWNEDEGKE